jgi:hypothetical protein
MKISGRSVSGMGHVTLQGGDAPLLVSSGPLLGITTKKHLPEWVMVVLMSCVCGVWCFVWRVIAV